MKINSGHPLVSIITPSYNQGGFIEDTLVSVMHQDYPNIEHIVIDGGSSDQTLDLLRQYQDRYHLQWVSESDEGQADAINKGFQLASGSILAWLNADDMYLFKDTIAMVVKGFSLEPGIDVLYGDAVLVDEDRRLLKVQTTPPFNLKTMLRGCYIKQPALFFKREIIENYQLDPELEYALDYEFWLRLANEFKFKHTPQLWAVDRNHPDRKIIANREAMNIESAQVVDDIIGRSPKIKPASRLGYKLAVGLRTRITGLFQLFSLYIHQKALSFTREIGFPAFFSALKNQLVGRNKDLY